MIGQQLDYRRHKDAYIIPIGEDMSGYRDPNPFSPEDYKEVASEGFAYPELFFEVGVTGPEYSPLEEEETLSLGIVAAQPLNGARIVELGRSNARSLERRKRDRGLRQAEEAIDTFFKQSGVQEVSNLGSGRYRLPETVTDYITKGNLPHPEESVVPMREVVNNPDERNSGIYKY